MGTDGTALRLGASSLELGLLDPGFIAGQGGGAPNFLLSVQLNDDAIGDAPIARAFPTTAESAAGRRQRYS